MQETVATPVVSAETPATVNYTDVFLQALGQNDNSCLPDRTNQCIGVYVYDLKLDQELVSINADTPFQYASAFKAPVLVYFLQNCTKIWDVGTTVWNDYFTTSNPSYSDPWYVSDEYRQILHTYLSDMNNWGNIDNFAAEHRPLNNGLEGFLDQRYFILEQVFSMITQSNNVATGNVLKFVYETCLPGPSAAIEQRCGGSNAITEFNLWFNTFSGIVFTADEPRRGLNSWDTIATTDNSGETQVIQMATYGIMDQCASQTALLACADNLSLPNAWTARDFFKFYFALFHLENTSEKSAAMQILSVDSSGTSRGYQKNMARNMGAISFSKSGYFGSIITDAGIVNYQGRSYIVVVMSYRAVDSISLLFGQYDPSGNRTGVETGLLQKLLEGTLEP